MDEHLKLLENNKKWASNAVKEDAEFFTRLESIQTPEFLWIGCSDSRIPADKISDTLPGEIFVHRNIANMVIQTDFNLLAVLEFAINHLKIKHVIVCGHYGCGGVKAAFSQQSYNNISNWIHGIKEVYAKNIAEFSDLKDEKSKLNRLVELNVKEQVTNLAKTSIIQKAWHNFPDITLHGWVYDLHNGLIKQICEMNTSNNLKGIFSFEGFES